LTGGCFHVKKNNVRRSCCFQTNGNTNAGGWTGPASTLSANVWHQLTVVYNKDAATNDALLFVDGAAVTSTRFLTPDGPIASDAASSLVVGNRPANDRAYDGLIDEVRVSSVSRAADWILTQYRNETDPSAFLTVGSAL